MNSKFDPGEFWNPEIGNIEKKNHAQADNFFSPEPEFNPTLTTKICTILENTENTVDDECDWDYWQKFWS